MGVRGLTRVTGSEKCGGLRDGPTVKRERGGGVEGEVVGNGGDSPVNYKEGKMPSCCKRKIIVIVASPENPALTHDFSESLIFAFW